MNNYLNRMLRAAKLDPGLYDEVEAYSMAMGQAMGVVLLSKKQILYCSPHTHLAGREGTFQESYAHEYISRF